MPFLRDLRDILAGKDITKYALVSGERAVKLLAGQVITTGHDWFPTSSPYVVLAADPLGVTVVPYSDLAAEEQRIEFSASLTLAIQRPGGDGREWQYIKIVDSH